MCAASISVIASVCEGLRNGADAAARSSPDPVSGDDAAAAAGDQAAAAVQPRTAVVRRDAAGAESASRARRGGARTLRHRGCGVSGGRCRSPKEAIRSRWMRRSATAATLLPRTTSTSTFKTICSTATAPTKRSSPASAPAGAGSAAGRGGSFDAYRRQPAESLSSRPSLKDHLLGQLAIGIDDAVDRIIAVHLIDMLDDAGYLFGDLGQVAALLGCPIERIEATLRAPAEPSIRPASLPAASPSAWRCNSRTAAGWMRRCGPCSPTWIWSPAANGRRWPGSPVSASRTSAGASPRSGPSIRSRRSPSIMPSRSR